MAEGVLDAELVQGVVTECAIDVIARFDEFSGWVVAAVADELPDLAGDEDLRRELIAATRGNTAAILAAFRDGSDSGALAPEQLRYARTLRRRGIRLDRFLAAYRHGQAVFQRLWMDELVQHAASPQHLAEALRVSSARLERYLGRSSDAVIAEYEAESASWAARDVARRAELAHRVLRDESVPDREAEEGLGIDLDAHHLGVIAWADGAGGTGVDPVIVERAVTLMARSVGAVRVLRLPVGTTSVWAWLETARPPVAAPAQLEIPAGVRIALGRSLPGRAGFRRTHRQAMRTERLITRTRISTPVIAYSDVELLALLCHDDEAMQDFLAHELGPLLADDDATAKLRETVRVYLEEQSNASRAAARLFLHKNTVAYRLRGAEELLGRRIDDRRLQLELALLLAHGLADGEPSVG